jgi:hypothetical protein
MMYEPENAPEFDGEPSVTVPVALEDPLSIAFENATVNVAP